MSEEMFGVHVEGLNDLDAALEKQKAKADEVGFKFVVSAAEIVNKRARENFAGGGMAEWRSPTWPKPQRVTGFLMNSIRASLPVHTGPGMWSIVTGPRTVYGRRIELGYIGHPLGGSHPAGLWPFFTTRPFPFLRPAVEDSTDELAELSERLLLIAQEA